MALSCGRLPLCFLALLAALQQAHGARNKFGPNRDKTAPAPISKPTPCEKEAEELCFEHPQAGPEQMKCLVDAYQESLTIGGGAFSRECFEFVNVQKVCQTDLRSNCPNHAWGEMGAFECLISKRLRPLMSEECSAFLPPVAEDGGVGEGQKKTNKRRKKKRKKNKKRKKESRGGEGKNEL
eukprot:g3414.t1